jgi:hypothetical protein
MAENEPNPVTTFLREIGRKGGSAPKTHKLSARKRSAIARKNAQARWSKRDQPK